MTDTDGNTALKRVFTDQGIVYKEENSDHSKILHTIVGRTLNYDTIDGNGWVKIEGSPGMPVNVDNVRMPFVYVHPVTGQIDTSLSATPGILNTR
jgi:hypothetical protein